MATLRDALLPVIDNVRALVTSLGFRQTQVFIRTRTWSSGVTGKGTPTDADVEIGANGGARPKVEDLGEGNFRLTKITPAFTSGGWHPSQLMPTQPAGTETYIVLVVDGFTRECRITDATIRPSFGYTLIVKDRK